MVTKRGTAPQKTITITARTLLTVRDNIPSGYSSIYAMFNRAKREKSAYASINIRLVPSQNR